MCCLVRVSIFPSQIPFFGFFIAIPSFYTIILQRLDVEPKILRGNTVFLRIEVALRLEAALSLKILHWRQSLPYFFQ